MLVSGVHKSDSYTYELLSCVQLFVMPCTEACQAPLSLEFSRPFPSPGDLLNPGIEPESPALKTDSLLPEPPGKATSFFNEVEKLLQLPACEQLWFVL